MIRPFLHPLQTRSSVRHTTAILTQFRSQGTAAIARLGNDQLQPPPTSSPSPAALKAAAFNPSHYHSTIYHGESRDFTPLALKRDDGDYYFEDHAEALFQALQLQPSLRRRQQQQQQLVFEPMMDHAPNAPQGALAAATEMDLVETAYANRDHESYDKILILMRHGEAKHNVFEKNWKMENPGRRVEEANWEEDYPVDPLLTGKGCGQMQSLSRRTATFFNNETTLHPELFVVSPLKRAIQSAIIAFPTYTSHSSLRRTNWVCHPLCMETYPGNKSEMVSERRELDGMFPGVDYDMLEGLDVKNVGGDDNMNGLNGREEVPLFESKLELMRRTDEFLRWIQDRQERVIVVSSHATWLHSLCSFSLQYEPQEKGLDMFKKGELRSLGIKFY